MLVWTVPSHAAQTRIIQAKAQPHSFVLIDSLRRTGDSQVIFDSPQYLAEQVIFQPPQGDAPRQTTGGASRDSGQCPNDPIAQQPRFTPLVPPTDYGLTVSEHPVLLAYVPQTSARTIFFSLKDEDDNHLYQTTFPVSAQSQVVGFRLPEDAPTLEVGKNYRWSMVLICEQHLRPDSPRVEGWIQRVEASPAITSQLSRAGSLEKATAYGEAGIWYDMLAVLFELRQAQPDHSELRAIWESLLESNGLSSITTAASLEQQS